MHSEYFYERSSRTRLPLVFEISVALDKCAATEQLKNLTAKTEVRDVVVIARAQCITQLLEEVMTDRTAAFVSPVLVSLKVNNDAD